MPVLSEKKVIHTKYLLRLFVSDFGRSKNFKRQECFPPRHKGREHPGQPQDQQLHFDRLRIWLSSWEWNTAGVRGYSPVRTPGMAAEGGVLWRVSHRLESWDPLICHDQWRRPFCIGPRHLQR